MFQRGVAEFVGTFTLIFVGCGSIVATQGSNLTAIGLAHGLAIGVMACAVGHISGAHFNPAVTLGFLLTKRIEPRLAATYWFAQFIAAALAAFLLSAALPQGQVDAVVYDAPVLLYYASHEGNGKVRPAGSIFRKEDYGIVFPTDTHYRKRVNMALLKLKESGVYDRLYQKWFGASGS